MKQKWNHFYAQSRGVVKMEICDEIRNKLAILAEEDYKRFISSLVPGEENIIGVRTPKLRILAKEISGQE